MNHLPELATEIRRIAWTYLKDVPELRDWAVRIDKLDDAAEAVAEIDNDEYESLLAQAQTEHKRFCEEIFRRVKCNQDIMLSLWDTICDYQIPEDAIVEEFIDDVRQGAKR